MADFNPYILKSTDVGKTWTSLKGTLSTNGPILAIAEDHMNNNLLFVGTEFGVYFTIEGGRKWIQLKAGLPTIAVREIAIQKRENDLVLVTYGRGFYILDDYSPLRSIFPVRDAMMYIQATPLGSSNKATHGESFYTASNPPFGATLTYYLREVLETKKEIRQEAEKEAEKKNHTIKYPTWDELKAEDEKETPTILITITDDSEHVIRKLNGTNLKGINRITRKLRYPQKSIVFLLQLQILNPLISLYQMEKR